MSIYFYSKALEILVVYYHTPLSNNNNSFATAPACTPCPQGDYICGMFKWGCDIQKTYSDYINKDPTANSGKSIGQHVVESAPKIGGTGPSKNCSGCNPNDPVCEIFKWGCEAQAWGAGGFDIFAKYFPYIALGGAAIILILLIRR